ncbi:MAG: GlxA family transcriptional regulator [Hyphomonadaceae bacterium]
MSKNPRFPPNPRQVALIIFPGFQILDAAGPIAAFEIAARVAPGAYALRVLAPGGGAIASSSGIAMPAAQLKGARLDAIDTLIAVGGNGTPAAMRDTALIAFLRRAHGRVRRIGSVCSGAFLLAAAGLLEGRRATTHWRQAPRLRAAFPAVRVEPDCIYIEDKGVWTSAGVSAGIDLALAMIAADLGAKAATAVAREMVVHAQRPGGQAQHSALLDLGGGERFAELNAWMRENVRGDLSVDALARRAAMSPRNFARAYAAATGVTPAKAVERLRAEEARAALERGQPIKLAAAHAGFNDTERMRRAFIRLYGAPPAALRRTLKRA